jgi:hypothetical protein
MLLSLPGLTYAGDFSFDVQAREIMSADSHVQDGTGVKASLGYDAAPSCRILLWGSYDSRNMRDFGQVSPWNLNLLGAGLGLETPLNKYLSLRGDIGWFFPIGSGQSVVSDEGQEDYWHGFLSQSAGAYNVSVAQFTRYMKRVTSGPGGEITGSFHYPFRVLGLNMAVGLNVGYRFVVLSIYREALIGGGPYTGTWFQAKERINYGGPTAGIGLTLKF